MHVSLDPLFQIREKSFDRANTRFQSTTLPSSRFWKKLLLKISLLEKESLKISRGLSLFTEDKKRERLFFGRPRWSIQQVNASIVNSLLDSRKETFGIHFPSQTSGRTRWDTPGLIMDRPVGRYKNFRRFEILTKFTNLSSKTCVTRELRYLQLWINRPTYEFNLLISSTKIYTSTKWNDNASSFFNPSSNREYT